VAEIQSQGDTENKREIYDRGSKRHTGRHLYEFPSNEMYRTIRKDRDKGKDAHSRKASNGKPERSVTIVMNMNHIMSKYTHSLSYQHKKIG
jgi:hypothetical protein